MKRLLIMTCLLFVPSAMTTSCGKEEPNSRVQSDQDQSPPQGQFEKKANIARWDISYVADVFASPPSRAQIAAQLGANRNVPFETIPNGVSKFHRGADGGSHVVGRELRPGAMMGAWGLGPCVGVIVSSPDNKIHWAFHFTATDSVRGTLNQYRFPANAKVMIFGGDDEEASRITLDSVTRYFSGARYIKQGYHDVSGMWVDGAGQYFVHQTELRNP